VLIWLAYLVINFLPIRIFLIKLQKILLMGSQLEKLHTWFSELTPYNSPVLQLNKGGKIMTKDPRQLFNDFTQGLEKLGKTNGAHVGAFMNLLGTTYAPGAIDIKTKELISVAIGVYNRCEYCIVYHTYKALEAGATREEILETAMVCVAFAGGPAMAYSVTLLMDSIDVFEGDFRK